MGDVAKVLATGFLKHGHDVMMGTRSAGKLSEWETKNPTGRVGSFDDAAKFADLVGWPLRAVLQWMHSAQQAKQI